MQKIKTPHHADISMVSEMRRVVYVPTLKMPEWLSR